MTLLPAAPPRQRLSNPATLAMITLIIASLATACSQELKSPAPTTDNEVEVAEAPPPAAAILPVTVTSEIDWSKARADLAQQRSQAADDDVFTIQSGGQIAPVPILLPATDRVQIQSGDQASFRLLDDGYYAAYPGERYDIIVNGTNQVAGTEGENRSDRDGEINFSITLGGAQIALSRYGADYLIDFECNIVDDQTGTCIDEEEALEVANALIIAGTQ